MSKKHAEEKGENHDYLEKFLPRIGSLTPQGISFVAKICHQSDSYLVPNALNPIKNEHRST